MLTLSQTLSYYKRKDVQKLILEHAENKEIGVRFNETFGKRPDTLTYENDILEFAKKGATSFHCSEETWNNPLHLQSEMRRADLDGLRIGWDLILDIDCPYWTFSKLTAYMFIKALRDHKIDSVTVKFSGGKGFHIAVPFEAFPEKKYYIDKKYMDVKDMFPEGPRKIAQYLMHYVNNNLLKIEQDKLVFGKFPVSISKLEKESGKSKQDMIKTVCARCSKPWKEDNDKTLEYICPNCDTRTRDKEKDFQKCPKCGKLMEKIVARKKTCECGSDKFMETFDISSIIALDTVLISSRHMYRMPYSLHEKTGLVSVPFDIKHILNFEKSEAEPLKFKPYKFLTRVETKAGEAELLFQKSFELVDKKDEKRYGSSSYEKSRTGAVSYDNVDETAVPEDFFPPCIKKISAGLEDGKKRALFVLIRFLGACNWPHEKIEEYVMKWNELNKPEKLRDTYIKGQLRYYKSQSAKEKILPPNCDNKGYMIDTQFCNPDGLCRTIKNPVQYAKRKAWLTNNGRGQRKSAADKSKSKTAAKNAIEAKGSVKSKE